ncbi:MAG: nitrogen fixation protein [Candidatus Thiodiazotropha sp. (ex Semelilucina semeliformis)]|nr:nitrogen fixation protein [Candidatus Thiodiazotropha sp. (ex Myrtea spinifera)]MCU7806539.1 nitrogen fixation protein [Candidatus Thiodiazotropha sp. (ex Semelilucina semeliformis)]MCU7827926.1 nitrogen fixation protein [Candidatus Thiodiazotropha sp. (ex Myrtea sp. 'scaly one' KF741663)]
MKIAITSQNFRSITQHAGKTRRFLVFEQDSSTGKAVETGRLDLPKEMSMHEFRGDDHPLFSADILVTGSSGQGFVNRMARVGVRVIVTSETDPQTAAEKLFAGQSLPAAEPHNHEHSHEPVMPRL